LLTVPDRRKAVLDPALPSVARQELTRMPTERLVPFATLPEDVAGLVAHREAEATAKVARSAAFASGSLAVCAFVGGCVATVLAGLLN
jgi:hypothetical protein